MAYVAIPDSDVDQDSPVKEGVLRQLRDNALALGSAAGIPAQFASEAFRVGTASFAGVVGGNPLGSTVLERGVDLTLPKGSFWPKFNIGGGNILTHITGNTTDIGDPDQPTFRFQYSGLLNVATVGFDFEVNYILDEPPAFGFLNLSDSLLQAEEAITSEIMLGLGDLAGSVVQGAVGAPKINRDGIQTAVTNLAGTIPASSVSDFSIEDLSFFLNLHGTGIDVADAGGRLRYPHLSPGRTIGATKQGDWSFVNGNPSGSATFDVDFRYISSRTPSGTFSTVTPSDLGPDAVIREGGVQGKLRDNTLGILNAAINAPRIVFGALNLAQRSFSGTIPAISRVSLVADAYALFPMFHTTIPNSSTTLVTIPGKLEVERPDIGSADQPRFSLSPFWSDPNPSIPIVGFQSYSYDFNYHYLVNT